MVPKIALQGVSYRASLLTKFRDSSFYKNKYDSEGEISPSSFGTSNYQQNYDREPYSTARKAS